MDKKVAIVAIILIAVLIISSLFTPIWVILGNLLSPYETYELKPLALYQEWKSKPYPEWYGCTSALCMGDGSDDTRAAIHGSYAPPPQWGFLTYTVPQSSGFYQGTPLSVTVYVRGKEANGMETATITPTLQFPLEIKQQGQTFDLPWDQGFVTFSYKFGCEGKTWEDLDDMIIGAIARPNTQAGEWVYWSEIWAVVEYDDTPPPTPQLDITFTMTVLTIPSNCDVNLLGIGTINSGDDGIAIFEDLVSETYYVTVSKTGYQSFTKTVIVDDDDAVVNADLTSIYALTNIYVPYLIVFLLIIALLGSLAFLIYKDKKKKR